MYFTSVNMNGIPTCIAFYGLICYRRPEDDLHIGRNMSPM